jgi:hypothetical protein
VGSLCLLVLGTSSCLNFQVTRRKTFAAPPPSAFDALEMGTSTLTTCLDALGAPLAVEEYFDGAALTYGGRDMWNWGTSLSIPVDNTSASLSYNDIKTRTDGLLLLFDDQLVLKSVRRGNLRELLGPPERRRPNSVED